MRSRPSDEMDGTVDVPRGVSSACHRNPLAVDPKSATLTSADGLVTRGVDLFDNVDGHGCRGFFFYLGPER